MKKNLVNYLRVFILAMMLVFALSGSSCKKTVCEPIHEVNQDDFLTAPSSDLETDVFIDATLSMQGFITEGSFSIFQNTIPIIERAVIKNNGKVNFYKFGTTIKNLPGRSYSDFDKKTFYTDGELNKVTSIEKVIEKADLEHLTLVITDLYQEKADINQLSELIKKRFIDANMAVGVYAVKSQFDGTVYDVGRNNYTFKYQSKADKNESYRPFYIVAFGKHADIAKYFDTLSNGEMNDVERKESFIISKFLLSKPITFDQAKITETKGLNEVSGVLIKEANKDNIYKEFKVKSGPETGFFKAQIPFNELPGIIEAGDELIAKVENYSCDTSSGTDSKTKGNLKFAPADKKNLLDIKANVKDKKTLHLATTVKANKLDPKVIYSFKVILRPKEFSLPSWINTWNMTGDDAEKWQKKPILFDGSKTYNLEPFLQTLWETTKKTHQPKVAEFYCYFRVS